MIKLNTTQFLLIILIMIVGFGIYWFGIRSSQIKTYCNKLAYNPKLFFEKYPTSKPGFDVEKFLIENEPSFDGYKILYSRCIKANGL